MNIEPPEHLDEQSRRLWSHVLMELRERGTWSDLYAPLLERYICALEQARKARARIPEDGLTEGANGQLFEHPAIITAREAERDATVYATTLLLTPASRAGFHVDFPWVRGDDDEDE